MVNSASKSSFWDFLFLFFPFAFVALLLLLFNKEGVVSPGLFAYYYYVFVRPIFWAVSRFIVDTLIDGFVVTKDFVS